MVLNLFGFKSQLWKNKKSKEPTITVLKYVQHSEFLTSDSYITSQIQQVPRADTNKEKLANTSTPIKQKNPAPIIPVTENKQIKLNIKNGEANKNENESKKETKKPVVNKEIPINENKTASILKTKMSMPIPNYTTDDNLQTEKKFKTTTNTEYNVGNKGYNSGNTKSTPATQETLIDNKKPTLTYVTENGNDDNITNEEFKVHKMDHDNISYRSYESEDTLEMESTFNREYSSQAASIFFGDDLEPEPISKLQNLNLNDDTSQYSQTSA